MRIINIKGIKGGKLEKRKKIRANPFDNSEADAPVEHHHVVVWTSLLRRDADVEHHLGVNTAPLALKLR
ncbi:hypothetical protein L2E82_33576 [Cichorium intybus]|uniref:Uncharacterized protein n=1 Tax=Cichorium intybus TaxID=13427 RepID=A0ACB9BKH8_CICIN|nr:hypothetical protein L2E82_33576 [Cichorium intybus]